ncbi:hypothetical protein R1sor_004816 [Riccia sorocarpa]|uniref:Uncharacterized protein n=1 Tax=Riccia sorocarpa TaxID=122646 RepID=A0ABD3HLJ5_9MARC
MVDPHLIREPVDETFEEWKLAPIIMVQPLAPPNPVEAREEKKKKAVNLESFEASKVKTATNHHIRHAWFKPRMWSIGRYSENTTHSGTSMEVQRFVEQLCELGWQAYEVHHPSLYERLGTSHIAGRLARLEGKAWLLTKVELWERWLDTGKSRPIRPRSFSWKMKGCGPISHNQLRWITFKSQITSLAEKHMIGKGSLPWCIALASKM